MKKIMALFLLMITITSLATHPPASARPIHNTQWTTKKQTERIVYIKDKTYHRSCCKHKSFTKPIALPDAQKKNYTPCKVCNP